MKAVSVLENEKASTALFTAKAEEYQKYRPSYPSAAVDLIYSVAGKLDTLSIADIGAGTGRMSGLLLERGSVVYGVEPNDDMRREAERLYLSNSRYHSVAGTGENTTLPSSSVDVIVCAESFHWFDNESSKAEFRRILKPGGAVFLFWNVSGKNAYREELERLNLQFCKLYKPKAKKALKDERAKSLFGENYSKQSFDNTMVESFEGLRGGLLSASYTPRKGDEGYVEYIEGLKEIFDKYSQNGRITSAFETVCFCGTL